MSDKFNSMKPLANKLLHEDGTITTLSGDAVDLQNVSEKYKLMAPLKNEMLNPDGTTSPLNFGGGSGGGGISSITSAGGTLIVTGGATSKNIEIKIDGNDKILSTSTNGILANLSITYDSSTGALTLLGKGNQIIGTANLQLASFLESAEVVVNPAGQPAGTYLVMTFKTSAGIETKTYININTLVEVYTAGNEAINISSDSKISVVVDINSNLEINSNGLGFKSGFAALSDEGKTKYDGYEMSKQDKLIFDNTPTLNSSNPVISDGIKKAIDLKQDILTAGTSISIVDNIISSTFDSYSKSEIDIKFEEKQNVLTFDDIPAEDSENPVKSGGVYSELLKKLDKTSIDNELYGLYNGGILKVSGTPHNDIYIDKNSPQTKEDGSRYFPFKTLLSAIDSASSGTSITFHIASGGSYTEDLILNNVTNWTFICDSTIGQFRSEITGKLMISGSSQRIGMAGLSIKGGYECTSNVGNIYFDNMAIQGGSGIRIVGNGYHQYDFCQFMSNVTIDSGSPFISMRSCSCENQSLFVVDATNATLHLKDTTNVTLYKGLGVVIVDGTSNFIVNPYQPIYPITVANAQGSILLNSGSTRRIDGTLAPISIGAVANYSLGKFEFEPSTSQLAGNRIDGGIHSLQVYDHGDRTGYTKEDDTLEGHLNGISNALDDVKGQSVYKNENTTGTTTLDLSLYNLFVLTLTGNSIINFANPQAGMKKKIIIKQDSTGNRTVTWNSIVKWPDGGASVPVEPTANKKSLMSLIFEDSVNALVEIFKVNY